MNGNADKFFEAHAANAIESARRSSRRTVLIGAALLLLLSIVLGAALFAVTLRPLTVIDHCPASVSAPTQVSDITVSVFLQRFIELYSAQTPDAALTIAEAYNLMTPKLQQVLSAERADAGRSDKWYDKNVKSDYIMEGLQIAREREEGEPFTVQVLGKFAFRPAVGFNGDYRPYEAGTLWVYIQAALVPVPVTEKSTSGLLVDYYQINYFNDEELRKAYLLKRNILFGEGQQ